MKLGFEESAAEAYVSGTQKARAWTEAWVASSAFCPSCGKEALRSFRNNEPGRDFLCVECGEDYQLKSTKGRFGRKLRDGAFKVLSDQINRSTHANFLFLRYSAQDLSVRDLLAVPKEFVSLASVQECAPLSSTARRAGWVGCNILLDQIPEIGRIFVVEDQRVRACDEVVTAWRKTRFLKGKTTLQRGWLIDVLLCVEQFGQTDFQLKDVYQLESKLSQLYPGNQNVRPKIRQQLQVLRDQGRLEFLGGGRYRLIN